MKKCILLVRVSTEKQTYDEQIQQLYNKAIKDGYRDEAIIPIAEKESGIKLKEIERIGLNRMKQAIESKDSNIDCVYAWEISRIGRTKKVLFSILEYLTERKIQLKISEPSISLLNDDKTINEASETVFTLFSQLAESEMRNKKARFKRGKEGAAKEGKYIGGEITYGYEIDDNGYLIINEEKIKVVKYIFNKFLTGNYSTYSLAKELQSLGYINYEKPLSARNFVSKILHNYNYAGISNSIYDYKYIIISKEDVDSAIQICKSNVMKPKSAVKNIFYCKSLIKTNLCNHTYIGNNIKSAYYCPQCKKTLYIPINTVDSIAWYIAITLQISYMLHSKTEDIETYNNQISILKQKIEVSNKNIENKNKSLDILNERIVRGKIAESKGDLLEFEINKELKIERNNIDNYTTKISEIERIITNIKNRENLINIDDIATIKDNETRSNIIHEHLDQIEIEKIKESILKMTITAKTGYTVVYYITTRNRKLYNSNFNIDEAYSNSKDNLVIYEYIERFKRTYTKEHILKKKENYQKNKKEINTKAKKRYNERKDIINAQAKERRLKKKKLEVPEKHKLWKEQKGGE